MIPFTLSGAGMALFFAPVANVVLSSVKPEEEGQASGANNAVRELGGVFGVAVLASLFAHYGGYTSGQAFVDGMTPAVYVGAAVVALGSLAAFGIKRRPRAARSRRRRWTDANRRVPGTVPGTRPFRRALQTRGRVGLRPVSGSDPTTWLIEPRSGVRPDDMALCAYSGRALRGSASGDQRRRQGARPDE